MADKRLWAKVDRNYFANSKVFEVLLDSHAAVVLHLWSILYSAQHLTDGMIPERVGIHTVNADPADSDALVDAGLWHRHGHNCVACPDVPEGKVYVHDYLEHQDAAHNIADRSRKLSEAGARGGLKAAQAKAEAKAQAQAKRSPQAEVQAFSKQRRGDETREIQTSSKPSASTEFDSFWKDYPRRVGKEAARKAFDRALKRTDVNRIMSGLESLRIQVAGKDPQFTPHPSTWLNEGRWDDEAGQATLAIVPQQYGWANQ